MQLHRAVTDREIQKDLQLLDGPEYQPLICDQRVEVFMSFEGPSIL